ncbi:Pentatricopeptide repeat-containing protein DOT4 chloroplastic [Bienertia sinuspersici]
MQKLEEIEVDSYTLGSALSACSGKGSLRLGKVIHCLAIIKGLNYNPFVAEALMEMYFETNDLKSANQAFEEVADNKDTKTWNTLILGYAWCNHMDVILALLKRMSDEGFDLNIHTWNGIISGHVEIGHYEVALQLLKPNLISQNAMLTAYAMHGLGEEGISLFNTILAYGFAPDEVTFLSVLSLVFMLGKCGKTSEAYEVVRKMPVEPDYVTWGALLGGCVTSGDVKIGEVAAEKLLALETDNTENFILLSNMDARSERWDD